MPNVEIYGRSDDLIEVTGDIEEELYADYGEPTRFMVLGYMIEAEYDGEWRFDVVASPDNPNYMKVDAGEHSDYNDYTEVLRINQPLDLSVTKL